MKYPPPRSERIVSLNFVPKREKLLEFSPRKRVPRPGIRAVLRRYLAINTWYRQMADKAGRVDLRQTMWMHPYLPSCDIVYSHPLVQPDCNSLEVCSMENQGRYLQRREHTITFELSEYSARYIYWVTERKNPWQRSTGNESSREHVSREISNWIFFVPLATIGFASSKICFNFIFHFLCKILLCRVFDYMYGKLSDRSIECSLYNFLSPFSGNFFFFELVPF